MKIGDVKLLKRLSKPLTELLDYEIHKETARSAKGGFPKRFLSGDFKYFYKYFYFHPCLGKISNFTHIFQMG